MACINSFSHYCDKMFGGGEINLRTKGFVSVYGLRMLGSVITRKAWWQGCEAGGHFASIVTM